MHLTDIIGENWSKYTIFDAFMSGITCAWPVIIPIIIFLLLKIKPQYLFELSMLNIAIPVICYFTQWQQFDIFLSHKLLYLTGLIYFVWMILRHLFTFRVVDSVQRGIAYPISSFFADLI